MSDVWERLYNNGNLFSPGFNPLDDSDSDGWNNAQKAVAGLDPFSSLSPTGILRPEIGVIHDVLLDLDHDGFSESYAEVATISWPIIAGKQYTLLYSPDLTPGSWTAIEQAAATADGVRASYFPVTTATNKMFWRIKVEDIDSDGDGLTDAEEYKLGTDPHKAQSITGIPDIWLATHFTSILMNGGFSTIDPDGDPDGDGLTNVQEAFLHTDPNVSDNPGISQEAIINGDFSQPVIGTSPSNSSSSTWDYWTAGNVPGWSAVAGHNIEFQNIAPEAPGNQYVELKAHPVGHYGIKQDVGTRKGATYLLTLDCRDRADVPPACSNFNVLIDGQVICQINFSDPTATASPSRYVTPGAWTTVNIVFTANNPVTLISLVPINTLNDTTGSLVDHVKLAPVDIAPDTSMAGVVGDVIKSATVGSVVRHFVSPKKTSEVAQDYVVLTATGIAAEQITPGNANQLFAWDATVGEAVAGNPMKWRVRRDIAAKYPVKIKKIQDGSISSQMVVWVVWSDVTASPAEGYQFQSKTNPTGEIYGWAYSSSLLPVKYWRFQFTIAPADIALSANNADIPNLMGGRITKPPGADIPYYANAELPSDHAEFKWDVSRQVEVTVLNPDMILKNKFPQTTIFANQTKAYDVSIHFPDNPVQGNDDPGAPTLRDEDDNPYAQFSSYPNLAHEPGQLSSSDRPEFTFLNSTGQNGASLAVIFNFREFARLNIAGVGTEQTTGKGWYRISDYELWHYVMAGLYGEFPTGCGVFRWVTSGSESAEGRFEIPDE